MLLLDYKANPPKIPGVIIMKTFLIKANVNSLYIKIKYCNDKGEFNKLIFNDLTTHLIDCILKKYLKLNHYSVVKFQRFIEKLGYKLNKIDVIGNERIYVTFQTKQPPYYEYRFLYII